MMLMNITGGITPGQILLYASARRTGKSMFYSTLCKEIILPMKPEPKYKFSRAKWYEAKYNEEHYNEVMDWCMEQFGPHPYPVDAWSRWIDKYEGTIHFRDSKDYAWFVLRWG